METSPTKEEYEKFQRHLDGLSDRANCSTPPTTAVLR